LVSPDVKYFEELVNRKSRRNASLVSFDFFSFHWC